MVMADIRTQVRGSHIDQEVNVYQVTTSRPWDDRNTSSFHGTEAKALEAYDKACKDSDIGERVEMDRWTVQYNDLLDADALHEVLDWATDYSSIKIYHNQGQSIEGAIILWREWDRHPGYASNYKRLAWGEAGEHESDLAPENRDRSWKGFGEVIMTTEEMARHGHNWETVCASVIQLLRNPSYRWRNSPTEEDVRSLFDLGTEGGAE
jgi:hypothetical protein